MQISFISYFTNECRLAAWINPSSCVAPHFSCRLKRKIFFLDSTWLRRVLNLNMRHEARQALSSHMWILQSFKLSFASHASQILSYAILLTSCSDQAPVSGAYCPVLHEASHNALPKEGEQRHLRRPFQ